MWHFCLCFSFSEPVFLSPSAPALSLFTEAENEKSALTLNHHCCRFNTYKQKYGDEEAGKMLQQQTSTHTLLAYVITERVLYFYMNKRYTLHPTLLVEFVWFMLTQREVFRRKMWVSTGTGYRLVAQHEEEINWQWAINSTCTHQTKPIQIDGFWSVQLTMPRCSRASHCLFTKTNKKDLNV